MRDDTSFVLNIRADPDDETARLIYADYLEERGDPRGELIRVQCELAHLAVDDPSVPELAAREDALLAMHGEQWLAPLRALGAIGVTPRCFRRGLIEQIVISAADFAARAEEICRVEPALSRVQLKYVRDATHVLDEIELPAQVRCLDFRANGLVSVPGMAAWSAQVEELDLGFNQLEDGVGQLAAGAWPKLKRLSVARNRITHVGAGSLARAVMPRLKSLSLALNEIGWEGLRSMAAWWRQLDHLEELDLAATGLGPDDTGNFPWLNMLKLKRLVLRGNGMNQAGLQALADQSGLWHLTLLDLRNNRPRLAEERYTQTPAGKMAREELFDALRRRYRDALLL